MLPGKRDDCSDDRPIVSFHMWEMHDAIEALRVAMVIESWSCISIRCKMYGEEDVQVDNNSITLLTWE
jgi:hypothetical protein